MFHCYAYYVSLLRLLCFTVTPTRRIPVYDRVYIFLYTLPPTLYEGGGRGGGWERGFLWVARSRLLPPDKNKSSPHQTRTPTSGKLKRNGSLHSDVTLTMFYR